MQNDGAIGPLEPEDTAFPQPDFDLLDDSGSPSPTILAADPPSEWPQPSSLATLDESVPGLEAVFDVPVTVQAILGRSKMKIADLIRMKSGHVIELDRRVGEPVDILVNGRLIARGEVVTIDSALGITVTEIIRRDEQ